MTLIMKIGLLLFWGGMVLWLGETAYFGWNLRPESTAELVWDCCTHGIAGFGGGVVVGQLFFHGWPNGEGNETNAERRTG